MTGCRDHGGELHKADPARSDRGQGDDHQPGQLGVQRHCWRKCSFWSMDSKPNRNSFIFFLLGESPQILADPPKGSLKRTDLSGTCVKLRKNSPSRVWPAWYSPPLRRWAAGRPWSRTSWRTVSTTSWITHTFPSLGARGRLARSRAGPGPPGTALSWMSL